MSDNSLMRRYEPFKKRMYRVAARRGGSVDFEGETVARIEFKENGGRAQQAYFDLLTCRPTGVDLAASGNVVMVFFD